MSVVPLLYLALFSDVFFSLLFLPPLVFPLNSGSVDISSRTAFETIIGLALSFFLFCFSSSLSEFFSFYHQTYPNPRCRKLLPWLLSSNLYCLLGLYSVLHQHLCQMFPLTSGIAVWPFYLLSPYLLLV